MARIRSIKPEFFKHFELFKAEEKYNLPLRIAFSGLWCTADREGRFKWKPMELKTDILPYDLVNFETIMNALHDTGFIRKYTVDGKDYGLIPSFHEHQRIRTDEAKSIIPQPVMETVTNPSRNSDESESWKGKEGKGNGKEPNAPNGSDPTTLFPEGEKENAPPPGSAPPPPILVMPFTSQEFAELWQNWKEYRRKEFRRSYKSLQSEQAALSHLVNLSQGQEKTANEIIMQSMGNNWQGLFELKSNGKGNTKTGSGAAKASGEQLNKAFAEFHQGKKPV